MFYCYKLRTTVYNWDKQVGLQTIIDLIETVQRSNGSMLSGAKLLLFDKLQVVENYFRSERINLLTLQMKTCWIAKLPSVFLMHLK
jgi:hypothetical protein